MKKFALILGLALAASLTASAQEWEPVFHGQNLKGWADVGNAEEGYSPLQDYGHLVWYRSIKIKEL